jgi:hypothetical protein
MDHQVFWISIVGALDGAAIAITVLTLAVPLNARPVPARAAVVAAESLALIVLVVVGLGQMNRARRGSAPVTITLPSVESFGASIERYVAGRKALIRIDQDAWDVAAGIVLQLSRLGVRLAVEDDWATMFPERFRAQGDEAVEIAIAASGDSQRFGQRPNATLIDASSRVEVHATPMPVSSPGAGRRP